MHTVIYYHGNRSWFLDPLAKASERYRPWYQICSGGGIGRRARLRIWYLRVWGFESLLEHQLNNLVLSYSGWVCLPYKEVTPVRIRSGPPKCIACTPFHLFEVSEYFYSTASGAPHKTVLSWSSVGNRETLQSVFSQRKTRIHFYLKLI